MLAGSISSQGTYQQPQGAAPGLRAILQVRPREPRHSTPPGANRISGTELGSNPGLLSLKPTLLTTFQGAWLPQHVRSCLGPIGESQPCLRSPSRLRQHQVQSLGPCSLLCDPGQVPAPHEASGGVGRDSGDIFQRSVSGSLIGSCE